MGSERRRHPRITADLPLRFVSGDGDQESFELVDLSESGARIKCGRRLGAMTRVSVGLRLPGRILEQTDDVSVDTMGVVVWSHPLEDGRFDTGVFFADLEGEQREVLRTFVQASA